MSHDPTVTNLTKSGDISRLLQIMQRLRDPQSGCPWDIVQDFDTIAPYTIEEAYEVADAIERKNMDDLKGELGDLLLQVVYHSQMAQEIDAFAFEDVVAEISEKMIRRHPHVFGEESRDKSAEQQSADWEKLKAEERSASSGEVSALDGVAVGLPALTRAVKLQNRAARVGFDWPETAQVIDKIEEEAGELKDAIASKSKEEIAEEFGDLMFVVANLARHLSVDPEDALRAANTKFMRRFKAVEKELNLIGKTPEQSDLEEMDGLWDKVKAMDKAGQL